MSETTTRRMIAVADLLDAEQALAASVIIGHIQNHEAPVEDLRIYLRTQRESLSLKGIDADYLYYALCYAYNLFGGE